MTTVSNSDTHQLFPIIHVGGLAVIICLTEARWPSKWPSPKPEWLRRTKWAAVGINLIALFIFTTTPAWIPIRFYNRLYQFKPYNFLVNYKDNSLFQLEGSSIHFYLPPDASFKQIQNYSELEQSLSSQENTQWLFHPSSSLPDTSDQLKKWCRPEFSTLPPWLGDLLESASTAIALNSFTNWTLYRCQSPNLLRSTLEETEPETETDPN